MGHKRAQGTPLNKSSICCKVVNMNLIGLAQRIKTLRRERGLTLEQVASRAGMTRSGLSKVENFRATPSLPALVAIAGSLGVTVSQLVDGLEDKPQLVVVRKGKGSRVERDRPRSKLVYHSLAGERHTKAMEPLLVVVPGNRAKVAAREALAHEGEEFLYVLGGAVDLEYMDQTERLYAGDSAYFDAHIPHRLINPEPRAAKVLCVFGGFTQPVQSRRYQARARSRMSDWYEIEKVEHREGCLEGSSPGS